MTGEVTQNIKNLRACSLEGLTAEDAAGRLNIGTAYVKMLAKRHAIYLARKPSVSDLRVQQIKVLADEGLTRPDVAARLDLEYGTVVKYALQNGIQFKRAGLKTTPTIRTRQMAALYQSGKTLQEIGGLYGITRERVRQLITKFHGLLRDGGGEHKRALDKRAKFEAKRNTRSLNRWGCNWDQYVTIRDMGKPTRAWASQKQNAAKRGISWELNLWQWWSIWQQSGHWAQRGRGQGYVMCRSGDAGAYAVGNVFVAPARENSSDQARKKNGLPIGVKKNKRCKGYTASRSINGVIYRLGSHPTPELAHAAYLACAPQHRAAA